MAIVCLDSHYFQWGILLKANESQKDNIPAACEFFDHLDGINATLLAPTPLITELLMGAAPAEREKILGELEKRFYVREYDIIAAKFAADVWNVKKADVIPEVRSSGVSLRTKIKVDLQILAIAMAARATTLYTEDSDFAKLAQGYIVVQRMPTQRQGLLNLSSSSPTAQPVSQSQIVPEVKVDQPSPSRHSAHHGSPGLPPPDSPPASVSAPAGQ